MSGFRVEGCECPDACEVFSYGAELSYAALSTLSVESLLTSDVDRITANYHKALEIRQRVLTENLEQTVIGLENITSNLQV